MKKNFEGIFLDTSPSSATNEPKSKYSKQIDKMPEKRFIGVPLGAREMVANFQDPDIYSKISIEKTPNKYSRLAGYCVLLADARKGLRRIYFNMPDQISNPPNLNSYIGYELEQDKEIPNYIYCRLGQKALYESRLKNDIFAAVEFGKGLDGSRQADGVGANIIVPRSLVSFVPRAAQSLYMLSRFHSVKSPMLDYYQEVSDPNDSINNTKKLVISGLIHTIK